MLGLIFTILAVYMYWERPKRYLSVFFIFALVSGGFQLVPLELMLFPAIGISKTFDWALVYIILIVLIKPEIMFNRIIWKDKNGLSLFGGMLCFLLLYSILHVGVEPLVAIRVFRIYIFFILLLPIAQLNHSDFVKVFRLLIYFTTCASFLYSLQPFLGHGILSGGPADVTIHGGGLLRFYNMPYYIMPVFFSFFIRRSYFKLKFHYLLFAINIFAIIISQHRNMLFSILFCYILYLMLIDKLQFKRVVIYGFISVIVFFGVDSYFDNKFSNGISELTELYTEVTPLVIYSTNISDISTPEFRKLHFLERYDYVMENRLTSLFGIGFLTEDAHIVKNLPFNIGLLTETGEIIQIDTSDIAWSLLIMHFGIIGILAFIYFYFSYIKILYRCRKEMICVVGILYVTTLFTNSFFGTDILLPHAISFLMFIAGYYYSLKSNEADGNNYQTVTSNSKANQNSLPNCSD